MFKDKTIHRVMGYPVCAGVLVALAGVARADPYTVLYSFAGGSADGANPYGSLIQSGDLLYGMTKYGGSNGSGTLFAFDIAGNTQNVLHSFAGGAGDGASPSGSLILSGNTLSGMTYAGGGSNNGTLFSFNTATNTQSVLYSFAGQPAGGAQPWGSLVQSGSTLYGMTGSGGGSNNGTLFSFNTATNTQSVLHSFAGKPSDGAQPWGSLIQSGNTLYGMSYNGGANSDGAIFSYNTSSHAQSLLYSFAGGAGDGSHPFGSLLQSGTTLYGMTYYGGGSNQGTIFAFNTSNGTQTVLHSFSGSLTDGSRPWGSLIQSGNTLYGMTYGGGAYGDGTVFSLDTSTGSFNVLHSFDGTDGANPNGDLLLSGNTLYGMTYEGGENNDGVIFSVNIPEPAGMGVLMLVGVGLLGRRRRRTDQAKA